MPPPQIPVREAASPRRASSLTDATQSSCTARVVTSSPGRLGLVNTTRSANDVLEPGNPPDGTCSMEAGRSLDSARDPMRIREGKGSKSSISSSDSARGRAHCPERLPLMHVTRSPHSARRITTSPGRLTSMDSTRFMDSARDRAGPHGNFHSADNTRSVNSLRRSASSRAGNLATDMIRPLNANRVPTRIQERTRLTAITRSLVGAEASTSSREVSVSPSTAQGKERSEGTDTSVPELTEEMRQGKDLVGLIMRPLLLPAFHIEPKVQITPSVIDDVDEDESWGTLVGYNLEGSEIQRFLDAESPSPPPRRGSYPAGPDGSRQDQQPNSRAKLWPAISGGTNSNQDIATAGTAQSEESIRVKGEIGMRANSPLDGGETSTRRAQQPTEINRQAQVGGETRPPPSKFVRSVSHIPRTPGLAKRQSEDVPRQSARRWSRGGRRSQHDEPAEKQVDSKSGKQQAASSKKPTSRPQRLEGTLNEGTYDGRAKKGARLCGIGTVPWRQRAVATSPPEGTVATVDELFDDPTKTSTSAKPAARERKREDGKSRGQRDRQGPRKRSEKPGSPQQQQASKVHQTRGWCSCCRSVQTSEDDLKMK